MDTTNGAMDPGLTPVRISDAASMLRRELSANERPYNKTVIKSNNSIIDEWYEVVLEKICGSSGTIMAGQMWCEWQYFYTGKTIKKFVDAINTGHVSRPLNTMVEYWVETFTNADMKQLCNLGAPLVGHGWKLLIDESFIREQLLKWDLVYSKSDDPLQWRKLANNHPKLWNVNGESPFWGPDDYVKISEKVMTLLKIPISPVQ